MIAYRGSGGAGGSGGNPEDYTITLDGVLQYSSCAYQLANQANFNSPVIIGNNVANCYDLFGNCFNYNQLTIIPNNAVGCAYMFYKCFNYNQPTVIPNKVNNCYAMFLNCYEFNQPITIPNSANNIAYMFRNCVKFNQPITIPNSVTNLACLFSGSSQNSTVTIASGVSAKIYADFFLNTPYNLAFTIPSIATDVTNMFCNSAFNRTITIPEGVQSASNMFRNSPFNRAINLPTTLQFAGYMFADSKFNTTINCLTNILANTEGMFMNTNITSAPIPFDNTFNITSARSMYENTKINGYVGISSNRATDVSRLLYNCKEFGGIVHIIGGTPYYLNITNLLGNCNNNKRKNIAIGNYGYLINIFRRNGSDSVVGAPITWTNGTNNFYNTAYNIYVNY